MTKTQERWIIALLVLADIGVYAYLFYAIYNLLINW